MTEPGRSRRHVAQLAYAGLALTFALGPSAAAAETDAEPVIQGLDPMTKLMRRFRAGPAIDPQAWDTAPTLTWPGLSAIQFEPNDLPDTCTGLVIPPRGGEIIDLLNLGAWDQLGDGSLTCRLKIRSPEAKGARIKFFNLDLPPGAQITLGTADGEVFGQYEGRGLLIDGEFWAATVPGETTFVEITIPSDQRDELIVADVSELLHEFLDVLGPARLSVSPDGPELSCHIDAACELAPEDPRRAAAVKLHFIAQSEGYEYSSSCSGSLLADADPDTQIPWLLTANHCFNTQYSAESLEVIYFDELENCDQPRRAQRVVTEGAGLIGASSNSDVCLVRLAEPPPFGAAFAGWSSSRVNSGSIMAVHHPRATRKRITTGAIYTDSFCFPANNYVALDISGGIGVMQPGSSGSPMYNNDGRVIGQTYGYCLNGGPLDCVNLPTMIHIIGRLSSSFTLLGLEPILNGPDPEDPYEPNNSWGQAKEVADGLHDMKLRDADDFFTVDVSASGPAVLAATYDASEVGIALTLMDRFGATIQSVDTGNPVVIQTELDQGRYWVQVHRKSGQGGPYELFIDFNTVAGDVTGDDLVNTDDLIVVLKTFGQTCATGVAGCGDVTGDGGVDFSDVRLIFETLGYDRDAYDAKSWKKQAKTIAKSLKDEIKQLDKADKKPVLTRIRSVPSAQAELLVRMLGTYGRTCRDEFCADVTGDGRVTRDDVRIALNEAGFNRDDYDEKQWTKTITRFFKAEIRAPLSNYPYMSETFALRILTTLPPSPPPAEP